MDELIPANKVLPAMPEEGVARAYAFEKALLAQEQIPVKTEHVLHAGLYARTLYVPSGVLVAGVLIKIPTVLIVHGDTLFYTGDGFVRLTGYNVLQTPAGRKPALVTFTPTVFTMLFATQAKTVDEAEREFTDEFENLITRKAGGICQEQPQPQQYIRPPQQW